MYAQVEKPKGNKSRAATNSVAQMNSNAKQYAGFVNNRHELITLRKMHTAAYNISTLQAQKKDKGTRYQSTGEALQLMKIKLGIGSKKIELNEEVLPSEIETDKYSYKDLQYIVEQLEAKGSELTINTKKKNKEPTYRVAIRFIQNEMEDQFDGANVRKKLKQVATPKIDSMTEYDVKENNNVGRRRVGVGEGVMLTNTNNGPGEWTADGGKFVGRTKTDETKWVAPNKEGECKVKVHQEELCDEVTFTVVEPGTIDIEKLKEIEYDDETAGAGMILQFSYGPYDVSFGNVLTKEMPGGPTNAKGCYEGKKLVHDPGDNWWSIGTNNKNMGKDEASSTEKPPYSAGTFDWIIPNNFKVVGEEGKGKHFVDVIQSFEIDNEGRIVVKKGGNKVERKPK